MYVCRWVGRYVCVFVYANDCAGPGEGTRFPGAWITGGFELSDIEQDSGLLQEKYIPLTVDPCIQSLIFVNFIIYVNIIKVCGLSLQDIEFLGYWFSLF